MKKKRPHPIPAVPGGHKPGKHGANAHKASGHDSGAGLGGGQRGGGGGAAAAGKRPGGGGKRPAVDADDARRAARAFSRWLDDYPSVAAAVGRHGDLEARLDAGGGLTKIEGFLPPPAAAGALAALRALPPAAWADTSAARDYVHNNISHAFESTKGGSDDVQKARRGGG
jgi:hypothetical protein